MIQPTTAIIDGTIETSLNSFLSSLRGGTDMLSSFLASLSAFSDRIQAQCESLTEEAADDTLQDAYYLATVIGSVASGFLELEDESQTISERLVEDITDILDDKMDTLIIRDERIHAKDTGGHESYIGPSFEWLLANLHNPYPSKAVKSSISRQTGARIKDIDAWFIDIRKRIGWNKLRRTHFSNKIEDIVDAATSFFKPSRVFSTPTTSYNRTSSIAKSAQELEFVALENRVKQLYGAQFPAAVDASLVNAALVNSFQSEHESQGMVDRGRLSKTTPRYNGHGDASSYPSPPHSPDRSPSPLPPTPGQVGRRRRRRDSNESSGLSEDETSEAHQRKKRARWNFDDAAAAASLPSPAPSHSTEDLPPSPSTTPVVLGGKRKRCLSDTGSHMLPKRPHLTNIHAIPRMQTVSEPSKPAAAEISFGCFIETNFEEDCTLSGAVPPPVDGVGPGEVPLSDVRLYQYDLLSCPADILSTSSTAEGNPLCSPSSEDSCTDLKINCSSTHSDAALFTDVPLDVYALFNDEPLFFSRDANIISPVYVENHHPPSLVSFDQSIFATNFDQSWMTWFSPPEVCFEYSNLDSPLL